MAENTQDKAREFEENRKAVGAAVCKALENRAFEKMLRQVALASSYAPGRSAKDVAFAEGKRAFAVYLLTLGGKNES